MASPPSPDPSAYDREFTFSRIGMVQRRMVWSYLDHMLRMPGMQVLELNCGTGTDAVHLARHGHKVLATDISGEMLRTAREKARQFGLEDRISHMRIGFDDLARLALPPSDLVLSNFGGFNLVAPDHLAELVDPIASALKPGGRLVAVLMPDRCASETLHHLFRGELKQAFKRGRHDPVWAGLSGTGALTWYHAPDRFAGAFEKRFRAINVRPIGLFVPTTHFERQLGHRARLLARLARWDERFGELQWTARYADHFLIDLELRR